MDTNNYLDHLLIGDYGSLDEDLNIAELDKRLSTSPQPKKNVRQAIDAYHELRRLREHLLDCLCENEQNEEEELCGN